MCLLVYNQVTLNYYLNSFLKTEKDLKNLKESYKKILICFSVIIPHFSNECLEDLDMNNNISWPQYDKKALEDEEVQFVIQINSKKRTLLKVKKDKIVDKYLNNKKIKKIVFVENRLMNILINE